MLQKSVVRQQKISSEQACSADGRADSLGGEGQPRGGAAGTHNESDLPGLGGDSELPLSSSALVSDLHPRVPWAHVYQHHSTFLYTKRAVQRHDRVFVQKPEAPCHGVYALLTSAFWIHWQRREPLYAHDTSNIQRESQLTANSNECVYLCAVRVGLCLLRKHEWCQGHAKVYLRTEVRCRQGCIDIRWMGQQGNVPEVKLSRRDYCEGSPYSIITASHEAPCNAHGLAYTSSYTFHFGRFFTGPYFAS